MLDIALKGLEELPLSSIQKARFELLSDRFAELERENAALKEEVALLKVQKQAIELERDKHRQNYEDLAKAHEEEIRVLDVIEFRRGKRTGGKWICFCPLCHSPAHVSGSTAQYVTCSNGACKWRGNERPVPLADLISSLSQTA